MDITKAKEFLEKQGLDDCHYQDSGMIEHIAEQMEMYHADQLRLGAISNSEVFEHYGKPFTSGRDLWDFLTAHYKFTPKT